MGNKKARKLIILSLIFLITSFAAYYSPSPVRRVGQVSLNTFLQNIDGYRAEGAVTLEPEIIRFLDLDDYTFTSYRNNDGRVELYVGYYFNADKVSAAHSPLSCFPGQGWVVTTPVHRSLSLGDGRAVQYAEITASLEQRKELVFYWYQAYQATTPHVYRNKIMTLYNKMMIDQEQHAFVRIAIPLAGTTEEKAREQGEAFIKSFFPVFLEFTVRNGLVSDVRAP